MRGEPQSGPCYGAEAGAWPIGWQQAKGPPPPGPASALLQGLRQAVLNPGSPAQPPAGVGANMLMVLLALLRARLSTSATQPSAHGLCP